MPLLTSPPLSSPPSFPSIHQIYELTQDICPVLRSRQQDFSDSAPLPHYIPSFADIYMIRVGLIVHPCTPHTRAHRHTVCIRLYTSSLCIDVLP